MSWIESISAVVDERQAEEQVLYGKLPGTPFVLNRLMIGRIRLRLMVETLILVRCAHCWNDRNFDMLLDPFDIFPGAGIDPNQCSAPDKRRDLQNITGLECSRLGISRSSVPFHPGIGVLDP